MTDKNFQIVKIDLSHQGDRDRATSFKFQIPRTWDSRDYNLAAIFSFLFSSFPWAALITDLKLAEVQEFSDSATSKTLAVVSHALPSSTPARITARVNLDTPLSRKIPFNPANHKQNTFKTPFKSSFHHAPLTFSLPFAAFPQSPPLDPLPKVRPNLLIPFHRRQTTRQGWRIIDD